MALATALACLIIPSQRASTRMSVAFAAAGGEMGVLSLAVTDGCGEDTGTRASAMGVWVDGRYDHELLLFPGSGRERYETLLGPLPRGRHRVELRRSSFWQPAPCLAAGHLEVRIAAEDAAEHEVLRRAPALELRADTVGEGSDLPLYAYAEDFPESSGRRLRYTVVFSNEDGGTPTRALLARWGRTTDIEQVYEVTLQDGRAVREEFQGPDHEIRAFGGRRRGAAPILLVATFNNMVTDRGRGVVQVRLVPSLVDLSRATRESTLDSRPWALRVMWRELVAEDHIEGRTTNSGQAASVEHPPIEPRAADAWLRRAPDPRNHVYLEGRLTLQGAMAAAWARDAQGRQTFSHYGRIGLAVDRDGWVRVAVPIDVDSARNLAQVGWACLAAPGRQGPGTCVIEAARAFVFGGGWVPGPNLVVPGTLELRAGEEAALPQQRRDR